MLSTTFPASFGRLLPGKAPARNQNDGADIELNDLSARKGEPRARAGEHHPAPACTTPLLDRICKQLSSGFKAAIRDIRDLFSDSKMETARPDVSGKDHAVLMRNLKTLLPHMAARPDAAGKDARTAKPAPTRRRPIAPDSHYRLATFKEALSKEAGKRPTADTFIRRMNHLQYQGRLAGQLEELNLRELRFLWSQASKGSGNVLSPEARKTLCGKGHLRLCKAFQAEARQYGRDPAGLERALPRWAARAPAEWHPKEALRQAYCGE